MNELEKRKLENYNKRIKKQNAAIKENYDRISCTLPKGTKERIIASGETVNGLVNRLVLEYLDNLK